MAKTSIKHLQINKNQTTMLAVIAVSTIFIVFGLFATKAMVSKAMYQNRAISAKRQAASDLKKNLDAAATLITQYKVFAEQEPNILGGSTDPNAKANSDGANARIVLDALPSLYDAPALATSVEKILTDQNIKISGLNISDDPVGHPDTPDPKPAPQTITFNLSGASSYAGLTKLLQILEHSIRPFNVNSLQLTGTDQSLQLTASVDTYYQPAKSLDMTTTKEVK